MAKPISGKKDSKQVFWKAHISAMDRSGLTLAEYCRRHRLSCNAFRYWRRKLGKGAGTSVSLVPVPGRILQGEGHPHACNASDLRLKLKGRVTIEIGDGFSPVTLTTEKQKPESDEGVSEGVSNLLIYITNNPGERIPEISKKQAFLRKLWNGGSGS